jgi:ATPase family associated with various cellular activities (AAA)
VTPYADSLEHLAAELARLDVLLRRELMIVRDSTPEGQPDDLRGLVITETEMDALAGQPDYFGERWRRQERLAPALGALDAREAALRTDIAERVALSHDARVPLALPRLAHRFGLSTREIDLLLIAIAPEVEVGYETLYAYLQNDVTRKRPSVDLALNLVARSDRDKLASRRLVEPEGTLVSRRLLTLGDEGHDRQPSFLRRFLRVDDAVVGAVLDHHPRELTTGEYRMPAPLDLDLEVDETSQSRLRNLLAHVAAHPREPAVIRLVGRPADMLLAAAQWVGSALGRGLLVKDLEGLAREPELTASLARDATISDGLPVITAPDSVDEETGRRLTEAESRLWRMFRQHPDIVLLLGGSAAFQRMPEGVTVWRVELRAPAFEGRVRGWSNALGADARSEQVGRLADAFRFGRAQMDQTIRLAGSLARLREPTVASPALLDILEAGRILTTPRLGRFALRVEPRYSWDDLVLPVDKHDQLRRLANWLRFRHQVHERWGFGRKLSRGKGLNALFTGPSGTGKTMAAEVLAGELSLDLYQIDLSSVVSKYIGETEKNLSAIFDEADESQAILFFDEADALFGKRTEVKDAHDRYANVEVNFLLQRVEQYEGIVILASNLQRNLDEAFLRRLHEVVEFPFPDEALRARMWRTHLPPEAAREPDIDFQFLARQFKFTGGSIKNIVVDAAFRAAADYRPIGMAHLILATKAELQKQGRLPTKAEFDRYYDQIVSGPPVERLVGR